MKHLLSFSVICIFICSSCSQIPSRTEYVLGTFCTINLFNQGTDKKYQELFSRLHELDNILSVNSSESNISEINKGAGHTPVKAKPETLKILQTALLYSEKTDGAFDPSVGPLVKAWNIGFDNAHIPTLSALQQSLELVDYHNIHLDQQAQTVFLSKAGMKLDLGAIAKGFAADELVLLISKMKIKRAIIDLGGNIFVYGEKASGKPWIVGIRDPYNESSKPIASVSASNMSIVTSGVYERFFEENGVKYHHILDTKTGFPIENNLLSVSIISPTSMLADTLSTSVFIMGSEKGKALIETLPDTDAILIFKDGHIETTGRLSQSIQILSDNYTLRQ